MEVVMSEDYRMEIDALKKEISELKELFRQLVDQKTESRKQQNGEKESITQQEEGLKEDVKSEEDTKNKVEIIKNMHPDFSLQNLPILFNEILFHLI